MALLANSSAAPIAEPSFAPFGPFVELVYVFTETTALELR
jgi:hypothetical protein